MQHDPFAIEKADLMRENPVGLLVLGMHRSGTSAVTGVLERLGVPVPGEMMPPASFNPTGFFENMAVCRLHERLLGSVGSAWDDPLPLAGDLFANPFGRQAMADLGEIVRTQLLPGSPIFAVKDPRLCRLVPLWREVFDHLRIEGRVVLTLRHPLDAAASLETRDGFSRAKSLLLWLGHVLTAERDTRDMPRSLVLYDDLLDDWRSSTDRIARDLGLFWPRSRERAEHEVDGFLQTKLRHHRSTGAIGTDTRLGELAERAWRVFLDLAADPKNVDARATLDAVSRDLEGALAVSAPHIAAEAAARHRIEGELAASNERERGQDARAEALQVRLQHEQETAREAAYRYEDEVRTLRRRAERADWLDDRVAAMDLELERLRQSSRDDRTALQAMLASTSWRLVQPIQRTMGLLPPSARRLMRRGAKASWWAFTPWRTQERLEFLRARDGGAVLLGANDTLDEAAGTEFGNGSLVPAERRTYQAWVRRYDTLTEPDRAVIRDRVARLAHKPLLSIVVPVYDTPEDVFRQAVASVRAQIYGNWELCIADDASPSPHVAAMLADLGASDPRIRIRHREANGHIAAASNTALEMAQGEFVILMDHDDLLAEHALYEIARVLNEQPDIDILYSDEDKVDEVGRRFEPYFKPDFSYDLLLGQNVISHLGAYRTTLLREVGGFRPGVDGSQDYDLALRCVARTNPERIHHIPKILYHWRQPTEGTSFSQSALDACIASARKAIQDHLDATHEAEGPRPIVEPCPDVPVWNRVRWPVPTPAPLVSIIVPTRDHAKLTKQCIDGLLHRTDYVNIEILIVDNGSTERRTRDLFASWESEPRIRVLPMPGPFNYSRLNNEAVREAKGDILLLLNNDIDVIGGGWLGEMVSLVSRPGIGAVGAKLLYGDRRVQHAGLRLGGGSYRHGPGVASHFGHLVSASDPGYFGRYILTQDVGGVTGACLMTTRAVFEEVGGLDERNLAVAFNDVDLCLRIREAGYRILWTPHATLFHLESASRGSDETPDKKARFDREVRYMRGRWGHVLDRDPFCNPAFDKAASQDYVLDFPAASYTLRD